jgi:hypothetical protein
LLFLGIGKGCPVLVLTEASSGKQRILYPPSPSLWLRQKTIAVTCTSATTSELSFEMSRCWYSIPSVRGVGPGEQA